MADLVQMYCLSSCYDFKLDRLVDVAEKKTITDKKSLGVKRFKSATCHRGVTCIVFFSFWSVR